MTQENKELLLKDLCARLPYGLKEVDFKEIGSDEKYIIVTKKGVYKYKFTEKGFCYADEGEECLLFPSKDQRDWSKFSAPWYKKESEPKFKVGDWVVNKFGDSWHIVNLDKKNYQVSDGKGNYNYFPISKQDEMHLWTIQDAKDGDILDCNEEILLFKSYSKLQGRISLYCWYNGHTNNFHSKEVIDILLTTRNKVYPATKEQRDLLFQKIKEAGYKWNVKTKTLDKLVKPKFDPKTLKPFDKVLVRNDFHETWRCDFFSHRYNYNGDYPYITIVKGYTHCIPYNDDTKHLVGTTDEAPEYYRYWED